MEKYTLKYEINSITVTVTDKDIGKLKVLIVELKKNKNSKWRFYNPGGVLLDSQGVIDEREIHLYAMR